MDRILNNKQQKKEEVIWREPRLRIHFPLTIKKNRSNLQTWVRTAFTFTLQWTHVIGCNHGLRETWTRMQMTQVILPKSVLHCILSTILGSRDEKNSLNKEQGEIFRLGQKSRVSEAIFLSSSSFCYVTALQWYTTTTDDDVGIKQFNVGANKKRPPTFRYLEINRPWKIALGHVQQKGDIITFIHFIAALFAFLSF